MIESENDDQEYVILKLSTMEVVGYPYKDSCEVHDIASELAYNNRNNTYIVFNRAASYRWSEDKQPKKDNCDDILRSILGCVAEYNTGGHVSGDIMDKIRVYLNKP